MEVTLLAPWILFLFAGTFDMGVYCYSLIATENAARVAAQYTSSSSITAADTVGACRYALKELDTLPNVRNLSSCTSNPVTVTATTGSGVDGAPATTVSVTYQTIQMIPIPGLIGRLTITRQAQMRLKDS